MKFSFLLIACLLAVPSVLFGQTPHKRSLQASPALTACFNEAYDYLRAAVDRQEPGWDPLASIEAEIAKNNPHSNTYIQSAFEKLVEVSWVELNELFPEDAPVYYQAILAHIPSANTVSAKSHPRPPLAYVGVGFLRAWFTFMQLESHFSDLVLLDHDPLICFCHSIEKLLFLMSETAEDYRALKNTPDNTQEWGARFEAKGEALSVEDQRKLHMVCKGYEVLRAHIKTWVSAAQAHAKMGPAGESYTLGQGKLSRWLNGDFDDGHFERLKRTVEEGCVHIVKEIIESRAPCLFEKLRHLYNARGVRLGLLDLSNVFNLRAVIAWEHKEIGDPALEKYIKSLDFFSFIQALVLLKGEQLRMNRSGRFTGVEMEPLIPEWAVFLGTYEVRHPHAKGRFIDRSPNACTFAYWAMPLFDLLLCERGVFDGAVLCGFPRIEEPLFDAADDVDAARSRLSTRSAMRRAAKETHRLGSGIDPSCLLQYGGPENIWLDCDELELNQNEEVRINPAQLQGAGGNETAVPFVGINNPAIYGQWGGVGHAVSE